MQKISGAGNVNNRFVAENVNTGQAPTQITADWMNAVQDELVNVVLDAGLTLDAGNNAQVLEALKKIFKTAQISIVTTTSALTYAMAWGLIRFNSTTAIAPTLPANNASAAGKEFSMVNNNVGIATVTCTGTDVISVNNTTVTSLQLGAGDTLKLIGDGNGIWYAVGGTAQFKYSYKHRALLTANGYQVHASGLIEQWVTGNTTVGVGVFTLPITFPNAILGGMANQVTDSFIGAACFLTFGATGLGSGRVVASNGAGGATTYAAGAVGYTARIWGY